VLGWADHHRLDKTCKGTAEKILPYFKGGPSVNGRCVDVRGVRLEGGRERGGELFSILKLVQVVLSAVRSEGREERSDEQKGSQLWDERSNSKGGFEIRSRRFVPPALQPSCPPLT